MARIIALLGFILLIPSVFLNVYLFRNQNKQEQHEVLRVIDGDTFETIDHKMIRLLGVNAPEIDACGGDMAKKELEKIILNQKITFFAPTVDAYNRLVADVYLPNQKSVNVVIIQSGWAGYKSSDSNDQEKEKVAADEIRTAKKGVYGPECYQYANVANPKCSIKGNYSDNRGSKVYSLPNCRQYAVTAVQLAFGDYWFCSETEAKAAGFTRSENCSGK